MSASQAFGGAIEEIASKYLELGEAECLQTSKGSQLGVRWNLIVFRTLRMMSTSPGNDVPEVPAEWEGPYDGVSEQRWYSIRKTSR